MTKILLTVIIAILSLFYLSLGIAVGATVIGGMSKLIQESE